MELFLLNRRRHKLFSIYVILLLGILQVLASAGAEELVDRKQGPLEISADGTEDIFVKVGENYTVYLSPTNIFNKSFELETEETLVFHYNYPDIVRPLPNVTLVSSGQVVFKNTSLNILPINAGRVIVTGDLEPPVANVSVENVFVRVSSYKVLVLILISDIVGWIYFAAWSVSFYPQIYQNWRRKSVRGLSLDFVFINITGFTVYGVYNIGLYWIVGIQDEYYTRNPTGQIPVKLNDVIFTMHAVFASALVGTQCFIYDRGSQVLSKAAQTILIGIFSFLFIMGIVAISNAISWLTFLDTCSYIKLFVTLIKYVPQAYLNWSRKSTSGWCIGNVLLDFTGGVFSIMQMCMISYNFNDWASIFGDFAKFGLGLFSICFDILFIIQHYFLYRNHEAYEPIEGTSHFDHEDMVTSNHIPPQDDEDEEQSGSITNSNSH